VRSTPGPVDPELALALVEQFAVELEVACDESAEPS